MTSRTAMVVDSSVGSRSVVRVGLVYQKLFKFAEHFAVFVSICGACDVFGLRTVVLCGVRSSPLMMSTQLTPPPAITSPPHPSLTPHIRVSIEERSPLGFTTSCSRYLDK